MGQALEFRQVQPHCSSSWQLTIPGGPFDFPPRPTPASSLNQLLLAAPPTQIPSPSSLNRRSTPPSSACRWDSLWSLSLSCSGKP